MDPVTHSALAIAVALAVTKDAKLRPAAALTGLAAGLLPDADVYLKSATDPLFNLEYHRHFTHSLALSPLLGAIAVFLAGAVRGIFKKKTPFKSLWLAGWLAILSHIFCDVWTSYGTRTWWPFLQDRVSLDWISVIDPVFTLPLIILTGVAMIRSSRAAAFQALAWCVIYLSFCVVQQQRVIGVLNEWVASEGLGKPDRWTVKPSFGNALVWRAMVVHGDTFRVIGVRAGLGEIRVIPGEKTKMFTSGERVLEAFGLSRDSRQGNDVMRFAHFSDQWLGIHPKYPDVVGDLRYANLPHSILPLWGIRLNPEKPEDHVSWEHFRKVDGAQLIEFWDLVRGASHQARSAS